MRDTTQFDAIIIGAGAAGLAAASTLSREGLRIVVLEARDRIGGRILTVRGENNLSVDLGAEFVHGHPPETFELADQYDLPLIKGTEEHRYVRNGKTIDKPEFWDGVEKVFDAMMKQEGKPDTTFSAFLKTLDFSDQEKQAALSYAEGFNAASADKIGVQGLIQAQKAADAIEGDLLFRFAGGYEQLIDAMASNLKSAGVLKLSTPVKQIDWAKGKVTVLADNEQSFSANAAVITVPLPILQRKLIAFIPDIPMLADAANKLIMGKVERVVFTFRHCISEGKDLNHIAFLHDPEQSFPIWWTQAPLRVPLLVGWASGPYAEKLKGSDILAEAKRSLQKILGMSEREWDDEIEQSHYHDWSADPYSLGAYCYVPAHGLPAQRALSEPIQDTLFFAGEATNTEGHVGTVHGAIATGYRAAKELISARATSS